MIIAYTNVCLLAKKYVKTRKFFEALDVDESLEAESFIMFEGSNVVVLSNKHPGVTMTASELGKIRSSSANGTRFCRNLLDHFFSQQKLAESNGEKLELEEAPIMEAIFGNSNILKFLF